MNAGCCIELASPADLDGICAVIGDSVRTVYPLYYTGEFVDFFLSLHEKSAVLSDIMSRIVYCARLDGRVVGTVTVCGNTVKRLFVSPRYMRRGIGSALMDRAEEMIFSEHDCAICDASAPAVSVYAGRGYARVRTECITCGGSVLSYEVMEKKK